jgi:hypothetical protein
MSYTIARSSRSRVFVKLCIIPTFYVVGVGIATIPIFTTRYPSLNDYLSHLARGYVLLHYNEDPAFARFFVPNWEPLPNLAFDVWVLVFGQVLPIEIAGKLFIAAIFALLVSGVIFLHRATFNRWSLWPFLSLVLLYNRPLLSGLLNFLFGVALWLHVLALWICLRRMSPVIRAPVLCVASLVVFFAHLFAFGILAVTIAVYELVIFASKRERWSTKVVDLVVGAAAFLPALAILAFLTPHSGASAVIGYRDFSTRLAGFAAPLLYNWRVDAICYSILAMLFAWAVATKVVTFNRPLTACVIVLFILQLAIPNVIMTAEGADHRIPIPMMLLGIAATDPNSATRGQRLAFILATAGVFLFRIATVEARWSMDQRIYADASAGFALVPNGALVAAATPPGSFDDSSAAAIALFYIPAWEVISHGGFTQTLFAIPTQHPLVLAERYAALAAATPASGIWRTFAGADHNAAQPPSPALVTALREYDYAAFLDREKFTVRETSFFQPFYQGHYVQIYRLNAGY